MNRLVKIGMGVMVGLASLQGARAQSALYPHHFNLSEVTLLDSPLKTAMDLNIRNLLAYDSDRLLTPFIVQAGLSEGKYANWAALHPAFTNWGDNSFNLSGHVGGHYLSALALAYAACHDTATKTQLKQRLDEMLSVLDDCQRAFDGNTSGLYGYLGGQPINSDWTKMYAGDVSGYRSHRGWVPFYCEHKVLAGLRDAYVYAGSEKAKEMFRKLADWSVGVVSKLSTEQMQSVLDTEHGGMNESLADAYTLFGDQKYLDAARKYSHQTMVNGMQTVNTTFLDGKHANTQVPKYIGFERVYEGNESYTAFARAAENFWTDVADNRTVCIGGNSVSEHFLSKDNSHRYIDVLDGPETCNSNNMLKLSEMLADRTHDAKYADFYEYTMYNHILSTQDPKTGGYVYFTTLRPQGYRIYSQVNQGMWCCVGTGMENHSKYGHFVYTHDADSVLYVNLFTASRLASTDFALTQQTRYPFEPKTEITIDKAGTFTLAIRHPWWTTADFQVSVNGQKVPAAVTQGKAGWVRVSRNWQQGDKVTVSVPMTMRYAECPNYSDYIAFEYGPVLLGAQTTAVDQADADSTGLYVESLQNEYAGAGRMDHAPGSMASSKSLADAPLLIGQRDDVLARIQPADTTQLRFTIDASRDDAGSYPWKKLTLKPFYQIHHARYMCYWYQQTAENFANSDMAATEKARRELDARTVDFVATGEQQSEAGHEYDYSDGSNSGSYNGETYRDAEQGGHVQFSLFNLTHETDSLAVLCRFATADKGRKAKLSVDGVEIASITIPASAKGASNGFYNVEYEIPKSLITSNGQPKDKFVVRLDASEGTLMPGLYYLRLMRQYQSKAYRFVASEWVSGDSWRLQPADISYNDDNTITVKKGGQNNVCLMLDYGKADYTITQKQKYLLVVAQGLSLADGDAYLWWLNGANHGSQVKPTLAEERVVDGKTCQVIAWDMTKSGIADNISTDGITDITLGQTIFGLTAPNGTATISNITFTDSIGSGEAAEKPYEFVAKEWVSGDSWRLQPADISYNADNTITVTKSGLNNVALMLDYGKTNYTIQPAQKFLAVMGQGLGTADGDSYLWWLNGANNGSQVAPDVAEERNIGGVVYQIIAWDITKSGLTANISSTNTSNISRGQTIFGLTASEGRAIINNIAFTDDVSTITGISTLPDVAPSAKAPVYTLTGLRVKAPTHGIYIMGGKKVVVR